MSKWYESDNPGTLMRGGAWRIAVWTIGILLFVGALSAIGWGIEVGVSNLRGQGNAIIAKNDAQNRIQQQAQFHQQFVSIKALDQKLTDAQVTYDAYIKAHTAANGTPFDPNAQQANNLLTVVQGLQQQCHNASASYDALTETYVAQDFRDTNLPFKISQADPVFGSAYSWADYDCVVTGAEEAGK